MNKKRIMNVNELKMIGEEARKRVRMKLFEPVFHSFKETLHEDQEELEQLNNARRNGWW